MNYSPRDIALFSPHIAPEEHVIGYALRRSYFETRGFEQVKIFHQAITRIGWLFPSNIEAYVRSCRLAMPDKDMDSWLNSHTLLPLLTGFLPEDRKRRLVEHHLGQAQIGMWALAGLHGSSRSRRGICTECLKEQYTDWGFGIWQRLFIMASVFACPRHGRPLFTFCAACESGEESASLWRPSLECHCGRSLRPIVELDDRMLEVSAENAKVLAQVLNQGLPAGVNSLTIVGALANRFKSNSVGLKSALYDAVGEGVLQLYGFQDYTYRRIYGDSVKSRRAVNPVQILLVVQTLLGGLSQVVPNAARAMECLEEELDLTASSVRIASSTQSKFSEKHRQVIQAWSADKTHKLTERYRQRVLERLSLNPKASRTELHRRLGLGPVIRHLKVADYEWLELNLPRKRSTSEFMPAERIRSIVLAIHKMYLRLLSTAPTQRIGTKQLLVDTPFRKCVRHLRSVPEIAFTLSAMVDDDERFFARKALFLSRSAERSRPHIRYSNPSWYTANAARSTVLGRFKRAEKWLNDTE